MASRTSRKVLPRKRVGKDRTNGPVQLALFSEEKAGSACSLPGGAPGEPHIGIDEAGRGCLAGPVVAAAVLFPEQFDSIADLPGLDDSKKLREAERERLAELAAAKAAAYGIGFAWQGEIDHINILNATFRAMSRAVLALAATAQRAAGNAIAPPFLPQDPQERAAVFLLPRLIIDGNAVIPLQQWHICIKGPPEEALAWECFQPRPVVPALTCAPDLPEQVALVGGDALVPAISAASILAKTVRDALMVRLDAQYPGYGLARHKGYGTREHLAALAVKGPCALHRRSFRRVRLEQEQCRMR